MSKSLPTGFRVPLRPEVHQTSLPEKFAFDREIGERGCVVGIDEVGRGPWAGPVVAAAVSFPPEVDLDRLQGLNDSKQLPERRREELAERIREEAFAVGIGYASPKEIDRLDIEKATFVAMARALEDAGLAPDLALVDGHRDPRLGCVTQCVVKGDCVSASIAAASILAKTHRDNHMVLLGGEEDPWGFSHNKGYGTEYHQRALNVFGVCEEHRRSFQPVAARLWDDPAPSNEFLAMWSELFRARSDRDWEDLGIAIAAAATFLETNEAWLLSHRLQAGLLIRESNNIAKNLRKKGSFHETAVLGYLEKRGYTLLEKNFQTRAGEIDLIAREEQTIVFIEVKMRAGDGFGSGAEAVDSRKRKRMIAAARNYLASLAEERDCRFDVIALDESGKGSGSQLRHFENAFGLTDSWLE
jgi:ribonuclease HII